jgi:hypothetical protein
LGPAGGAGGYQPCGAAGGVGAPYWGTGGGLSVVQALLVGCATSVGNGFPQWWQKRSPTAAFVPQAGQNTGVPLSHLARVSGESIRFAD